MANLKDIRNRIKSVQSIQQVTRAMKMVAAAKLRKSQERMEQARPYAERLEEIIQSLLPDVDRNMLDLLDVRDVKRLAFVVVTSDRGLAGSFNTTIIKKAEQEISVIGKDKCELYCIGRKGRDHFKKRDYQIVEDYIEFWNDLNYSDAIEIGQGVIQRFLSKEVDEIRVVYNYFQSVGSQKTIVETLLPLTFSKTDSDQPADRIYEPSKEEIVTSLVPRHLNIQMWKYLLESYASEQAARMVAMDNATENSGEMIRDLQLQFNKARQASITTEMLEIVGGAEALNA